MSLSYVIGSTWPFEVVLLLFAAAWTAVMLSGRKKHEKRAEPTPLEMYAVMRLRKDVTVRRMRRVAREQARSPRPRHREGR